MSNINYSQNKKGEDFSHDKFKIKINLIDYNQDKNSILLKDMISYSNHDKINLTNSPNRNNITMQKWTLHDPIKNRNSYNKQSKNQEKMEENSPPQKVKRIIQTAMSKVRDCKTMSPQRIQEINVNQKYNLEPNMRISPNNNTDNYKIGLFKNDNKSLTQNYDTIKTKEVYLDTEDRFLENLNKTNFFTQRTNSLIEVNIRKKIKQKQSKSPSIKHIDNIQEENEINKFEGDGQENYELNQFQKGYDNFNSKFLKANYSNLLTSQSNNIYKNILFIL